MAERRPDKTVHKPRRAPEPVVPLHETAPLILTAEPGSAYALVDSGGGRKLERYGDLLIDRPEAQAIWQQQRPEADWAEADAVFTGEADDQSSGRWRLSPAASVGKWPMSWNGVAYWGRFTSFRHVGVFPEQEAHWRFIVDRLDRSSRPVKLLNLFAYTGVASLVAAAKGAHVTHVDASRKAIQWARENQELAGLADKPVRWICDDAVKFCQRELRRGNTYDAILLDPPKYGRGPKGETWQLHEDLPELLDCVGKLISRRDAFVVLTAYSIRASFQTLHELMRDVFGTYGGRLESGELVIVQQGGRRRLSTSLFSRWVAP